MDKPGARIEIRGDPSPIETVESFEAVRSRFEIAVSKTLNDAISAIEVLNFNTEGRVIINVFDIVTVTEIHQN